MSDNDTLSFKPTDRQRELVRMYQEEEGDLKKSDALRELIDAGLASHFRGIGQSFFWELAKMSIWVGLTVVLLWWWSNIGQLPVVFYLQPLTYIFLSMAVLSLVIHLSDFEPLSSFKRAPEEQQA